MLIRTVFDARPKAGRKYAMQTILLAASWCHYVGDRSTHPLEVLVIGEMSPVMKRLLTSWGVRVTGAEPHESDRMSRHANKLLGAVGAGQTPLLLVDNDTCFVADVDELRAAPGIGVMAAAAGRARVSPAQWRYIEERLGLKPLDFVWCSLHEEMAAYRDGTPPRFQRDLYVNSGVVWLAHPAEFGARWAEHMKRIAEVFDGHPLWSSDVGDFLDQAGLATAIGAVGNFALLDDAFNYRPRCFWMGKRRAEQIRLVHMTGMDLAGLGPTFTVEEGVRTFWDARVRSRIGSPGDMRWAASEWIFERIHAVIARFDLDRIPW